MSVQFPELRAAKNGRIIYQKIGGFRDWGLGFRVQGLQLGVQGSGLRV